MNKFIRRLHMHHQQPSCIKTSRKVITKTRSEERGRDGIGAAKIFLCGVLIAALLVVISNERNLRSFTFISSTTTNTVPLAQDLKPNERATTMDKSQRSLKPNPGYHPVEGTTNLTRKTKQPTTQSKSTPSSFPPTMILDLISIGSILKPEWQLAQRRTFASHRSIRHYFRVNEYNDTDATCWTHFTNHQLQTVLRFCNNTDTNIQSFDSMVIRKKLFWPKRHTGWLCAQKRPIDGLYLALRKYEYHNVSSLPSFLIIMDDDTYINMELLINTTLNTYDIGESHVVAGCRYTYPRKIQFSFAYGGFGTFLTRAAIQRLLEPIYCRDGGRKTDGQQSSSPFVKWACWRLDQNLLGETNVFQPGMSLGTLMYEYAAKLPFTKVESWKDPSFGYCLHSDHALAYFFNYYHLGVPDHVLMDQKKFDDKIRMEYSYEFLAGGQECANEKYSCLPEHRICHYIRPERMDEIYAKQQQQQQQQRTK